MCHNFPRIDAPTEGFYAGLSMITKKTLILGTGPADMETAGEIIRGGGLVVFPTETVYGLGANALDGEACGKIFDAKGRPADNPLIVHLPDVFRLSLAAGGISPEAAALIAAFMPGPLTIILPKSSHIPGRVTAGLDTVGLRVPSDPTAGDFLRRAGVPVAAPSANLSGKPSPTTFEMARDAMYGRVDAIIRGGDCPVGLESTILRVGEGNVEILRPGRRGEEDIRKILKNIPITGFSSTDPGGRPPAPGMKYTHYKPHAEVFLFTDPSTLPAALGAQSGRKIGVISLGPLPEELPAGLLLRETASAEEYARRLYAEFFVFDKLGCEVIYASYPPQEGLGRAIGNRLLKASAGRFIES